MNRRWRTIGIVCASFLSGYAANFAYVGFKSSETAAAGDALRANKSEYKYTNPLLLCDISGRSAMEEFSSLRKSVSALIDNDKSDPTDRVSVYFRDLNQGKWFGIDENDHFVPASLLKVPVAIAFYKLAETDPTVLSKNLTYDGSFDENKGEIFKSQFDIKPGVYKVEDLIKAMVVNSDNNAMTILDNYIVDHNKDFLDEVFTDLGLTLPSLGSTNVVEFMSAKSYSYIFRVLYNATYLSKQASEKLLAMMAGPDFPQGIKASLPDDLQVAQKFGERSVLTTDNKVLTRELHDCGIIYYPSKPYLICIMTAGKDFQQQIEIIQGVSKIVYDMIKSDQ